MAGTRVDIVVADDAVQKAVAKYIQVVLFRLGLDPRVKALPAGVQYPYVQNSRNRVEAALVAVELRLSRRRRSCSTACSAATHSCPSPMRAPTSAGSATARSCSR